MTGELVALLGDVEVGRLRRDGRGRLSLEYVDRWRLAPEAYPISLSMPLALVEHRHASVDAYLWGLLPGNELIVERWARRFQVSPRDAFGLMTHVGQDCAGAVRFVSPDRARNKPRAPRTIDWLDEAGVAERLRALRSDVSVWRRATDRGQFSLAGAQPKTALLFDGKRWGVPSGVVPTTHILKPGLVNLDGHADNEHFCLELAGALGLPVARSRVVRFEDQVAIVVERYDRRRSRSAIVRIHQEDACQALGVPPGKKYESEGGPGARAIVELVREHSGAPLEDVDTFIASLVLHWLIGGTDAHAKNYSLLIGAGGRARLAPLYDIASALPYAGSQARKLKLAMKVGGKYGMHEIGLYQWRKLAGDLRLDDQHVLGIVRRLAVEAPDAVADVLRRARRDGLAEALLLRLAKAVSERAKRVAAL